MLIIPSEVYMMSALLEVSMSESSQGAYKVGGRFPLGDSVERRAIGDIYQATDETTGAPVHVILVSPHIFPNPGMKERALSEIQSISQSRHPNIVSVLDVGSIEDGRLYAATEVPRDTTLATQVGTQGPLTLEQSVALVSQIIAALEEGKRLGVWHRDISPANVVLSADLGTARLQYFGLAEPAGGAAFGDPWFMAPEQVQGSQPDERSIIYCVGALWYYSVCGAPVFPDSDSAQVLQKHAGEQPQPPSQRCPALGLPPVFDSLVSRALVKDPGGRFSSLGELLTAGKALSGSAGPSAQPGAAAADLGGAATMMAPGGMVPQPEPAPQAEPAPAPAPQAEPAPAPAPQAEPAPSAAKPEPATQAEPAPAPAPQAEPAPSAAKPEPATQAEPAPSAAKPEPAAQAAPAPQGRRRKKKGFRETLWFMKGELEVEGEGANAEDKELAEVQAGDGSINDKERSIDDRYRDDGSVTVEDRRKYSIKTGQTGMMPAVQAPSPMDAKGVPDLEKRKGVLVWVLILLVVLGGGGAAGAYFFMLKPPETFVKQGLGMNIAAQVSDYQTEIERQVLVPPELREIPKGEDEELMKKLLESAEKPEAFLPDKGMGTVDYLAALEKRRKAIAKKNEGKRRKKTLFRLIHRRQRKAQKLRKKYLAIKAKAITGVKEILDAALESEKESELRRAKAACMQVVDTYELGDQQEVIQSRCDKVDVFFGGGGDASAGDAAKEDKDAAKDKAAKDKAAKDKDEKKPSNKDAPARR